MKLKFINGFALHLWESEVTSLDVSDNKILLKTPSGKIIDIKIPSCWFSQDSTNLSLASQRYPKLPINSNNSPSSSSELDSTSNVTPGALQEKNITIKDKIAPNETSFLDLDYLAKITPLEFAIKEINDVIKSLKENNSNELDVLRKSFAELQNNYKKISVDMIDVDKKYMYNFKEITRYVHGLRNNFNNLCKDLEFGVYDNVSMIDSNPKTEDTFTHTLNDEQKQPSAKRNKKKNIRETNIPYR